MNYRALLKIDYPELTRAEELDMIAEAQTGNMEVREQLLLIYMRMLWKVCSKYRRTYVNTEELMADAIEGFFYALEKYNKPHQKFSAFVFKTANQRVKYSDFLRSALKLSDQQRTREAKIFAVCFKLQGEGTAITLQAIADHARMRLVDVEETLKFMKQSDVDPLGIVDAETGETYEKYGCEDKFEVEVACQDEKEWLLEQLNPVHAGILRDLVEEEKSLDEVASELERSLGWVKAAQSEARKCLHAYREALLIEDKIEREFQLKIVEKKTRKILHNPLPARPKMPTAAPPKKQKRQKRSYSLATIQEVKRLHDAGVSRRDIHLELDIPYPTVDHWCRQLERES